MSLSYSLGSHLRYKKRMRFTQRVRQDTNIVDCTRLTKGSCFDTIRKEYITENITGSARALSRY